MFEELMDGCFHCDKCLNSRAYLDSIKGAMMNRSLILSSMHIFRGLSFSQFKYKDEDAIYLNVF